MIIFHEGLPGSGKSYEALCYRIIPALVKGRAVVAYVEGLNFDKIAALANISVERCRELLTALTREQCADVLQHVKDNALHVFDEAQNFWGNKERMSKAFTEFVTEHRHRGMDIVLMGQDYRDVHALWRRRIEIKLAFLKLSGIGASKSYSVTTWKHKGGDEYTKVGTEVHRYDPKYFGSYASHTSDEISTADYKDGRAMILNHPGIKYGFPVVLVAAIWGAYTAWKFFHPVAPVKPPVVASSASPTVARPVAAGPVVAASAPDQRSPQERKLAELSGRSRIRLAGIISTPKRTMGLVEWVDGNAHVSERLSFDALRDLGVAIIVSEGTVRLALGQWSELATQWPLEADGKVSTARLEAMRPKAEEVQGGGLIIIGPDKQPAKVEPAGDQYDPAMPLSTQTRKKAT